MQKNPLISVIVNCHNGEEFLKRALDSIYSQSYSNWEIIFFDNASTDQSSDIAKSYDQRLRYFFNEKLINLGHARAKALENAKGEWIAFLDSDDIWNKYKLEKQMEFIKNTKYVLSYAGVEEIDINGDHIRYDIPSHNSGPMLKKQLEDFEINMVTPIVKRSSLIENNLTFNRNMTASEEFNLFIRLAAKGDFHSSKEILGSYTVYEDSLTNKKISRWAEERFETIEELIHENKGILSSITPEFISSISRGLYYKARYYFDTEDPQAGRRILRRISLPDIKYLILYLSSFSKSLWRLIHSKKIKSKLTRFFK